MGLLERFEARIDRMVNRPFARAFRSEVQPVEVAAALQRECDDRAAVVSRDRTVVPNVYAVELGFGDHARLSAYSEQLRAELAAMVSEHVEEQRYAVVGPVRVELVNTADLATGMFRVSSRVEAGPVPPREVTVKRPVPAQPSTAVPGAPKGGPEPAAALGVPGFAANGGGPGPQVAGARNPSSPPLVASLLVHGTEIALPRPVVVLGRGEEVDVRLEDPGVSRRHAALYLHPDARVVDLGSTNGTWVDGRQVTEALLHDGAQIVLGRTVLVLRLHPDGSPDRSTDHWTGRG